MSAITRSVLDGEFPEKSTALLSATILDEDGVTPLANADTVLTALTLTLYESRTKTVVNSLTATSILNANGGTVTSAGALTLRLDADDMAIVNTGSSSERHIALLQWTWGTSPVKYGKHEIEFTVKNLEKVT